MEKYSGVEVVSEHTTCSFHLMSSNHCTNSNGVIAGGAQSWRDLLTRLYRGSQVQ